MSEDRFSARKTAIDGVLIFDPKPIRDDRGHFVRVFDNEFFSEHHLPNVRWVQENQSRSAKGTLRGLHFRSDLSEAKLVRCTLGAVFEAVVDLRPESSTYLATLWLNLDDVDHRLILVPPGCAHGFQALTERADILYKHSSVYKPSAECAVRYDDQKFDIPWPLANPILSERDQNAPSFIEIEPNLRGWFSGQSK